MSTRIAVFSLFLAASAAILFFWLSADAPGTERAAAAPEVAEAPESRSRAAADLASPEAEDEAADDRGPERRELAAPAGEARDASVEAPAGPMLAGRVVDRFGNPLAGALVEFAPEDHGRFPFVRPGDEHGNERRAATTTDDDGRYTLEAPAVEALRARVRVAGFAPFAEDGIVPRASGTTEVEDFALTPGAILRGRVVDADGRAVAGASLFVEDRHSGVRFFGGGIQADAETTADGSFSVDYLACGPWRVRVDSDEHPTGTFEGLAERPGEVVDGLEWQLLRGNTIEGRLAGLPADEEAEGLVVRAYPVMDEGYWSTFGPDVREAPLDASGGFRLRGLRGERSYRVQARRAAGSGLALTSGRSLSDAVEAEPGDRNVVLAFQPESVVTLRVIDAETGAPIERMHVAGGMNWPLALRDEEGKIQKEFADGRVRFDDLRRGELRSQFQFEVSAVGYEPFGRDDVDLVPGSLVDLGVVALEPVPVVHVTVVDLAGRPIPGARATLVVEREDAPGAFGGGERRMRMDVRIEEDDEGETVVMGDEETQTGRTGEDGVCVLTSFQGERCRLSVEADGYAPETRPGLLLPVGQKEDFRFVLGSGASVTVTVLAADGQPVPGMKVAHRAPFSSGAGFPGHGSHDVTDAEGQLRFEHLAPGVHGFRLREEQAGLFTSDRMVIQLDGMEPGGDWTEVELDEGAEETLVLQMGERGTLRGRVLEAGVPLAGAALTLRQKKDESREERAMRMAGFGGSGPKARTDGDGDFEVEALEAGAWIVEVSHPTRQMPDEFEVEIDGGTERLDVDLPVSILTGRVTGSSGEPLAGVRVTTERAQEEGQPRARAMRVMMVTDGGDAHVSIEDGSAPDVGFTDADGRYELRGVRANVPLVVKATHDSAQPGESERVEVDANQTRSGVDLVLEPAGSLEVSAENADGTSARFLMVQAQFLGAAEPPVEDQRGFIGPNGATTLTGLCPGPWRISLSAMGPDGSGEPTTQEVEVRVGETVELPFVL